MTNRKGILADWELIELCESTNPMITPFSRESVRVNRDGAKIPSYGLSSFGYDVTCGFKWVLSKPVTKSIFVRLLEKLKLVKPKVVDVMLDGDDTQWESHYGSHIDIPPLGYAMGHTREHFNMPDDVSAIVLGKSTLARHGLIVNCTPIEAGFVGEVVIEIFNGSSNTVRVHSGQGIAQFMFLRGSECTVTYRQRKGKYQHQTGVQLSKN